jgi:hypothetical protein
MAGADRSAGGMILMAATPAARALRLIDWIWTVRGSVPLGPRQSSEEALALIDTLLREPGTMRQRDGDRLTFRKIDPLSQDKLAVFERGQFHVVNAIAGSQLRYVLRSRALLFCLLASPFFLGVSLVIDSAHISGRVFAALFAVLYVAGRFLEPWLAARLFARTLAGEQAAPAVGLAGMTGNGAV